MWKLVKPRTFRFLSFLVPVFSLFPYWLQIQDVNEREYSDHSRDNNGKSSGPPSLSDGFAVRGAPWSAPDTNSMDDFPDLGAAAAGPGSSPSRLPKWGPRR